MLTTATATTTFSNYDSTGSGILFIPLSEKESLETNKHVWLEQEFLDKDFKVNEKIKFKIKFLTTKQQIYDRL